MKKFKFRLETVLKVRGIELEQQGKALALALLAVSRARDELLHLQALQVDEIKRVKALTDAGQFSRQILELSIQYRDELKRKEAKKAKDLQKLMEKAEEERLKLVEKEKRKKVIEKLEERDRENYEEEHQKAERKDMDELASIRWWVPRG